MERATGNDPASVVWKRMALPLSYARVNYYGIFKEQTT